MNIRSFIGYNEEYFKINREERNLTAILYHLLLLDDNLKLFLKKINCKLPVIDLEIGIYYEYSFLRDLWNNIGNENKIKRELIVNILKPRNSIDLLNMSIKNFNEFFGGKSVDYIESPGNWAIRNYEKTILDNEEFLKICKFKWCFKIKPDLVIHTSNNSAVCIEAKYESNEGLYPSNNKDKDIFRNRGINAVGQLSIQKKLMEDILGLQTEFIFLVQKKTESETHKNFTWNEIFNNLDTTKAPYFIKEWLKKWGNTAIPRISS